MAVTLRSNVSYDERVRMNSGTANASSLSATGVRPDTTVSCNKSRHANKISSLTAESRSLKRDTYTNTTNQIYQIQSTRSCVVINAYQCV